jgi:ADP-ribose pyrophosphatase YjhB (NUDIX family)
MSETVWKPHTTVAAMCERDGKFLLVKEKVDDKIVFNQPAGHLEPNESLLDAVVRETLEETQTEFTPTALLGIYRSIAEHASEITYLRFLFAGKVGRCFDGQLDDGIISAHWMSYDEIVTCREQHRSPMVLQCVDDYLHKEPVSLEILIPEFR